MATSASQTNIEDMPIKRIAIDTSGCLGSLYDAHQNRILRNLGMMSSESALRLDRNIQCEIKTISGDESQNLFELIDKNEDLQVSILLGIAPKDGLASLTDYSHPVNEYTRFLQYTYINREEKISNNAMKVQQWTTSPIPQTDATHIITGVTWGINVVVILQLPHDSKLAAEIDGALKILQIILEQSKNVSSLTEQDINLLEQIHKTKVYSNTPKLMEMASLLQIYQYITEFRQKSGMYYPLLYTLQPIRRLCSDTDKSWSLYNPLKKSDSEKLKQYLIEITTHLKKMSHWFDCHDNEVPPRHPRELVYEMKNEWENVQKAHKEVIERLKTLIFDIRSGKKHTCEIDQILQHKDQTTLMENTQKLVQQINDRVKHQVDQNNREQTLKRSLSTENQSNQTLCSEKKQTNNENAKNTADEDNVINILLLGESGVGKSTFINAFVNYLKYQTLSEAELQKPVVLIPVSFLMTTGDDFSEKMIELSVSDKTNNEDFRHPGQSVTQRCKSYIFDLNRSDGRKLRIIDTPGFGDTRGLDQDDTNMQHILEYIHNLSHLNAVCFLLQPNLSRLNICFRTCLIQLLDLLGSNALQKIIFCFTNSRCTFYTPGNTGPLLKTMLKSLPIENISFQKENTFCFDSESFRYLVAQQNGILFNDEVKCDYEASWLKSVTELNRLLKYVCQDLTVYHMHDNWQSIKHAQLEIIRMIRPMLEVMRNSLRNNILYTTDPNKIPVALCPKAMHCPITICLSCKHELIQIANFWILPDCQHNIQGDTHKCPNNSNQHMSLDYVCDYNNATDRSTKAKDELLEEVSLLTDASAMFSNFLLHTNIAAEYDLFLTGLKRILDDERYICTRQKDSIRNIRLFEDLEELKQKYINRLKEVKMDEKNIQLSTIYNLIKIIRDIPDVRVQLTVIKRGQQYVMKHYEFEVPSDSKNDSIESYSF